MLTVNLLCLSFLISGSETLITEKIPCIPVLGFGYNDDPQGFVPRLLGSIDFCVDLFVIVAPEAAAYSLDQLASTYNSSTLKINTLYMPRKFIGVAETWNKIIQSNRSAPWYLICAYDVKFLPGQLMLFSQRFWKRSGSLAPGSDISVNFAHTRWLNMPGGKGFNLFGMSREVVDHVGYFDENIYPAFWEDRDYKYRLQLWNGTRIRTFADIRPIHGFFRNKYGQDYSNDVIECLSRIIGASTDISVCGVDRESVRYISGTRYVGRKQQLLIRKRNGGNFYYVIKKWACDPILSKKHFDLKNCTYTSPFNSSRDLSYW